MAFMSPRFGRMRGRFFIFRFAFFIFFIFLIFFNFFLCFLFFPFGAELMMGQQISGSKEMLKRRRYRGASCRSKPSIEIHHPTNYQFSIFEEGVLLGEMPSWLSDWTDKAPLFHRPLSLRLCCCLHPALEELAGQGQGQVQACRSTE